MDLRSYARAKEIYDNTPMDKRKNTPLMNKVGDIKASFAREKIEEAKRLAEQEEAAKKKPPRKRSK